MPTRLMVRVVTDLLVLALLASLGIFALAVAQTPATEAATATNWNTIALAAIGMVGTAFGLWITYQTSKIHTAVNSERTATTAEIKRLNEIIAQMGIHLAAVTGSAAFSDLAARAAKGGPVATEIDRAAKTPPIAGTP